MAKKININKLIFYAGFLLEFVSYFFSTVVFKDDAMNQFISVIHYISFIVLMIAILIDHHHSKRKLIEFVSIYFFGMLNYFITGDITIATIVLVSYASKRIEIKQLIKTFFWIKVLLIGSIILMSTVGITINYIDPRTDIFKASLGFTHPNVLGVHLFSLMIYAIYLYRGLSLKKIFILGISLYIICFIAGARTSIVSIGVTFILIALCRTNKLFITNNKLIRGLLENAYLFGLIISFIMGKIYTSGFSFIAILNILMSKRLYYFNYYLENYNITLFGQPVYIQERGWNYITNSIIPLLTLDNAYLYYYICGGIIGTFILYWCFRSVIRRVYFEKDIIGVISILSFMFFGFSEVTTFNINNNLFLLLLYNKSKYEDIK